MSVIIICSSEWLMSGLLKWRWDGAQDQDEEEEGEGQDREFGERKEEI